MTYFQFVKNRFFSNRLGVVGLSIVVVLILIAVFSPLMANDKPIFCVIDGKVFFPIFIGRTDEIDFSKATIKIMPPIPHNPYTINLSKKLQPPSLEHPLGTDDLGRDVLSRIVYGTTVSISVGVVAVGTAFIIGTTLGLLAGYYRGIVDMIIMRVIEVFMTFPTLFLILTILAFLPPNIYNIMFVIGITGWTGVARLVRGETLRVVNMDFVRISKITGVSDVYILFRHILPNAINPALVSLVFGIAGAVLVESSLSFLGLGVQPPTPSWGNILLQGNQYIDYAWWLAVFPGIAIFITVTSLNLLGEALRDAMDPRVYME
ncbi:MAG: ABC transporter permease [Spirochaetia bacterium]|nr:ABC transporter permease [Spirochaetota bacterium]MCX8096506.1 ABC transporter permease [Spirochaetota bacterium]MDW8112370.1 ABC transporter permease [Spirochaetia bacterium]